MSFTNNSDRQTAENSSSNVVSTNSGVSQRQGEGRISKSGAIVKLQLLNLSYDKYYIHTSSNIALALLRNIKNTPVRTRRSVAFVRRVRNQLLILNNYNRATFETKGKYPYSRALILLLVRYVQLEFDVLYHPENYSAEYEEEVEEKVRLSLHLLLDGVVRRYKQENQVCTAAECALRVLNQVSTEYKVKGRFVWSLINKLANQLGLIQTISQIRHNAILTPQNNPVFERLSCDDIEDISDCESDGIHEIPPSPDLSCDSPIETLRTDSILNPEPPYLDSGQGGSFNSYDEYENDYFDDDSDSDVRIISEVNVQRLFDPRYEVQDISSDDDDDDDDDHLDLIANSENRESVQIRNNQSNSDDVAIKSTNESKSYGDLKLNRITNNYSDNYSLTVFGSTSGYKNSEYGQNPVPVIEICDDDEDDDVIEVIDVPKPMLVMYDSPSAVQQAQVPREPSNEIKRILLDSDDDDDCIIIINEDEKFNEEVKKSVPRTTSDNQVNEISSTTGKELTYTVPFSSTDMPINNNFVKTSAGSSENNPSLQSYKKMKDTPEQSTSHDRDAVVNEKLNIEDDDNSSLSWKENMMRVCHGIDVSLCFPEYIPDKIEENYTNITSLTPGPNAWQTSGEGSDSKNVSFQNMMCKQVDDTPHNFFFKQLSADEQTKENTKKANIADNTAAIASTSKGNAIHMRKGKSSLETNTSESKQHGNQKPVLCEGDVISSLEVALRNTDMSKLLSNIDNLCFQTAASRETLPYDRFKMKSTNTTLKKKSKTPVIEDSVTNNKIQFHCSKHEGITTETNTSGEGSHTLTATSDSTSKILPESNIPVTEPLLTNFEKGITSDDAVLQVIQKPRVIEERILQETDNECPTSEDAPQTAVGNEALLYDSLILKSSDTTLKTEGRVPVIEDSVPNGESQFNCSKNTETDTPVEGNHAIVAPDDNAPKIQFENNVAVKEPSSEKEVILKDAVDEVNRKVHDTEERILQETDEDRPSSQNIRQTAECSETLLNDSFKSESSNIVLETKIGAPEIEDSVTNGEIQFHCSKNESIDTDSPGEGSHALTATDGSAPKILTENNSVVEGPSLISNSEEEITSEDAVFEVSPEVPVTEERIPQETNEERSTSQEVQQTVVGDETLLDDSIKLESSNTILETRSRTPEIEDSITNGEIQFHCSKSESINTKTDISSPILTATNDDAPEIPPENNTAVKELSSISNLEEEVSSKDVVLEDSPKAPVTEERIPQEADKERPTLEDVQQTAMCSETLCGGFKLKSSHTTLKMESGIPIIEESITNGEIELHCSKNESINREPDVPGKESHTLTDITDNAPKMLSENNIAVKASLTIQNSEEETASKDVLEVPEERVSQETENTRPSSQNIRLDGSTLVSQIEEDKSTCVASPTEEDKNTLEDQFEFETSGDKLDEKLPTMLEINDCSVQIKKIRIDSSVITEDYDMALRDRIPFDLEKSALLSEVIREDLLPIENDEQTSCEIQSNLISDPVDENENNQSETSRESGVDDNVSVNSTLIESESETGLTSPKNLDEPVEKITEKTLFEIAAISDSHTPTPIKNEQSTSVSVTSDTNNKRAECEENFVIANIQTDTETILPTCKSPKHPDNAEAIANDLEKVLASSEIDTKTENSIEDLSVTKESRSLYTLSTKLEKSLARSEESSCHIDNSDEESEKLVNTEISICEERIEEHQQCESPGEPKNKLEEEDQIEDNPPVTNLQSLLTDCNIGLLDTNKTKETCETSLVDSFEVENISDIQNKMLSENQEISSNLIEEPLNSNEFAPSDLPTINPMESLKDDDDIEDNSKLETSSLENIDSYNLDCTEDKKSDAPDESEPCHNATAPLAPNDIEEIFLILPNGEEVEGKNSESVEDNGDEDIFFILDTSEGDGEIGEGVQFKEDDMIHLNFVIEEDENKPEESPENVKGNETVTVEENQDVTQSLPMEDVRYDGADIPTLDEEVCVAYYEEESENQDVAGTDNLADIRRGKGDRQQLLQENGGFENQSEVEDMCELQSQEVLTAANILENEEIHEVPFPEVITLDNQEEVTHEAICDFQIPTEEVTPPSTSKNDIEITDEKPVLQSERSALQLNNYQANETKDAASNIDTDNKESDTLLNQITNVDVEANKPDEIESNAVEAEPDLDNEDEQIQKDQSHEDIGQKLKENATNENINLDPPEQIEIGRRNDEEDVQSEAVADEDDNSQINENQPNPSQVSSCEIANNNVEPCDDLPIADESLGENGNCEQTTKTEIDNHTIIPSHETQISSSSEAAPNRQWEPESSRQSIVVTSENEANHSNNHSTDSNTLPQYLNLAVGNKPPEDVTTLNCGENIDTAVDECPIKSPSPQTDKNATKEKAPLDQQPKEINVHEVNIIPHDVNASCVDLQTECNKDQAISGLKCLTSEEVQCFVKAEITDITDKCKVLYSSVVAQHDRCEPVQIAAVTVESEDFRQSFNVPLGNIEKANAKKSFLSSTHTQNPENMEDPYENLEILATAAAAQKSLRVENNAVKYKRSRIKMAAIQKSNVPGTLSNFKPNEVRETVTKQPVLTVYATAPTESDFSAMSEDSSDSFGGKLIIAEEEQSVINEAIFDEDTVEENITFIRTKIDDIENAEIQISIKDSEIYEEAFDETNEVVTGVMEERKTSKTPKPRKLKGKSLQRKTGKKMNPCTSKSQTSGKPKETTPKSRKNVKKVSKTIDQIEAKTDSEIDDIPLQSRIANNFKSFFNKTSSKIPTNKDLKEKKNINEKAPVKSLKKKPVDKFADLRSEIIKRRAAQMNNTVQKESKGTNNSSELRNEHAEIETEPPTVQICQNFEHHTTDDHRIIMGKSSMLTHDGEIVKVDILSSVEHKPEITVEKIAKFEGNADTTRIEQESATNENTVRHPIRTKAELKSYDKKNNVKDGTFNDVQDKFKLRSYVKLVRNPHVQKMIEEQYKPSFLRPSTSQKVTLGRKSYKNLLHARHLLHRTNALQTHATKINNSQSKSIQKAKQNSVSANRHNESTLSAENAGNIQKKIIEQETGKNVDLVRKLFDGHKVTNEITIDETNSRQMATTASSEGGKHLENITGNGSSATENLPKYRRAARSLSIEVSRVSSMETMTKAFKSRSSNSEPPKNTNSIREKPSKYCKTSRSVSVDVKSSSLPNLTNNIEGTKISKCNRMNSDSNLVISEVNSSIPGKQKEPKSNKNNADDVLATIQPLIKRPTRELRRRSIDDHCLNKTSKIQKNMTKGDDLNFKKTVSKLSAIGTTLEEIPVDRNPSSKKQTRNVQPTKQKENSLVEVTKEKPRMDNSEKLTPKREPKMKGKTIIDRIPEPTTKSKAKRLNTVSSGNNGRNNLSKQTKQNLANSKSIESNSDKKEDSTILKSKSQSEESLLVDEDIIENDDAEAKKIKFMEDTLALTAKKGPGKRKFTQKDIKNCAPMNLKSATFIGNDKKVNEKVIDVKGNLKSINEDNKVGEASKVQDLNDVKLILPTENVKNVRETVNATKISAPKSSEDDNQCIIEAVSTTKKIESEDFNEAALTKQLKTNQDGNTEKHPNIKDIAEKDTEVTISCETLKSDKGENVEAVEDIKEIEMKDNKIETKCQDVEQIQDMACEITDAQEVINPNNITIVGPSINDVEVKKHTGGKTKESDPNPCSAQNLQDPLEVKRYPKSKKEKRLSKDKHLPKTVESENKNVITTSTTDTSENNIAQIEAKSTETPNEESEKLNETLKETLDVSSNSSKELIDESTSADATIIYSTTETKDEISEVTDEDIIKNISIIDCAAETKDEILKKEESNGDNLPIANKVDTSVSMEEERKKKVIDSLAKLPTIENNEQKPPEEIESKSIRKTTSISSNTKKIEDRDNCHQPTPFELAKESPENATSVTNQRIVLNVPKPCDRKSIIKKTLISSEQLASKGLAIQQLPKKKRVTFNIADIIFDANTDIKQPKTEVDSVTDANSKQNSSSSKVEEVLVKKQENESGKETTDTKSTAKTLIANKITNINPPPPKILNFEQHPKDLKIAKGIFADKNIIKRKLFDDSEIDAKKQKTEDFPKIEIEKLKMSVKNKLERSEANMKNKEPIVTSPTKRKDTRKNIDDIINSLRSNLDSKDFKDLEEKDESKRGSKQSNTDTERIEVTFVEIIDDSKRNGTVKDLKTLALETQKRCFFQPWQDIKSEENKPFDGTINSKSPLVQDVVSNKSEDIDEKISDKIEQVEACSSKSIRSNESKTPAISISNDPLEEPRVSSPEVSDTPIEDKMDTSILTANSYDAVNEEKVMEEDKIEDILTEEVSSGFTENNFSTSTPLKLIQREYSLISEDSVQENQNSDSLEKTYTAISDASLESDVKDASDTSISENVVQDLLVNKDEANCTDDGKSATITPTEELVVREVSNDSTTEKVPNSPNNAVLDPMWNSQVPLDLEATGNSATSNGYSLLSVLEGQPSEKQATKVSDEIGSHFSISVPDNSAVKEKDTKMTSETSSSLTESAVDSALLCTTENTETPLLTDESVQQKNENFILENCNPIFEDSSKMQEEMLLNFSSDQFPEVTSNDAAGEGYNAPSTSVDKRNDLIDPLLNLKTNDQCLISCSTNDQVMSDIIVSAASQMADLVPSSLSWSHGDLSERLLLKDSFERQNIDQTDGKIFSNSLKNDISKHADASKDVSEKLDIKPASSHLRVKDESLLTLEGVKSEQFLDNMLRTSASPPIVRESTLVAMTTQMSSFVDDQVQTTSSSDLNSSATFTNTLALNPENPNPILGKDFDTIDEDDTPITEKLKANGGTMQIGSGTISDHNYSMGGPLLGGKCEPSNLSTNQLRQERDQRSSTEDLDNTAIESDSIFPFSEPVCISLIENNLTQETNRSLNHSPVDTNTDYHLSEQDSQLSFPFIQDSSQQLQDNHITSDLIQNLKQECDSDQDSNITSLIEDYDQLIRINPMSIEKMISFQKLMHSNSQKLDESCIPDQNNFLTNFDLEDMESISLTSDNSKPSELSEDNDKKITKEVKQELPTEKVTVKFNEHEFASMDSIKDIIYPKSPQINKDDMIRSSTKHKIDTSPKQRRQSVEKAGSRSPRKNKKYKEKETMLSNFSSAMKAKAMADIERKKCETKAKEVNTGYPIRQNKKTPVFAPVKTSSPAQDKKSPVQINSNPSSPIIKLVEEPSTTPKKNTASLKAEPTTEAVENNKKKVDVAKEPEQIQEKPKETIREIVQDMVQDGVLDDFLINLIKKRPSTDTTKPPPKILDSPPTPSRTTNTDTIHSMDFYDKYDTIKGRKRRQPPGRLIDELTMEMLVKDNKSQSKQTYKDQNKPKQYFRDQSKAKKTKFDKTSGKQFDYDESSLSDEPSKFDKRLKRNEHELGFKRYADNSKDDFLNKPKRPRTQAELDRLFDALKEDEDIKLLQKKANPTPVEDTQSRSSSNLLNSNPRRSSTLSNYYYDPKRHIPPQNRNDIRTYQGKLSASSQSCSSSNNVILNTHYQQRNPYRQYQNPPNPRYNSSMRSSVDNSARRTVSGSRGQPFPPLSNIRVGNPRTKDDLDWMNKVSPFIKQPPVTFGTENKQ